jgi:hypothetical protein
MVGLLAPLLDGVLGVLLLTVVVAPPTALSLATTSLVPSDETFKDVVDGGVFETVEAENTEDAADEDEERSGSTDGDCGEEEEEGGSDIFGGVVVVATRGVVTGEGWWWLLLLLLLLLLFIITEMELVPDKDEEEVEKIGAAGGETGDNGESSGEDTRGVVSFVYTLGVEILAAE